MRKKYKNNTKKSHRTTKEESKRRRKEQIQTKEKSESNEQNGSKDITINKYFKCEWTKFLKGHRVDE